MAFHKAGHLSHVRIIGVDEIGRRRAEDGDDPPAAGMTDGFALAPALESDALAFRRLQPLLDLADGHVDCQIEIPADLFAVGRFLWFDVDLMVFASGLWSNELYIEVDFRRGLRSMVRVVKDIGVYDIVETGAGTHGDFLPAASRCQLEYV